MKNTFIFGGDTGTSYDDLQRRRAHADLMQQRGANARPRNGIEGLNSAANSIFGALIAKKAGKQEQAGKDEFGDKFDGAFQRILGGQTGTPFNPPSTGSPQNNTPFTGSQDEFIQSITPFAQQASQQTGVAPEIIIAQAALESGWGKHAPGNNFFGIKSHGKAGGNNLSTKEVINGQTVTQNASFRDYADLGSSVQGYADFINNNPRYGKLKGAQGIDAQLEALQASGYATDPNYSNKLRSIIGRIGGQPQQSNNVQVAQSGGIDPELFELASNPYASEGQKAALQTLIQQKIQGADPLRQLQLQKLQKDLNTTPERKIIKGVDGRNYYQDNGDAVLPNVEKTQDPTTSQRDYAFYEQQERQAGREPLSFNQWDLQSRKAGATNINNNNNLGDQGEFDKQTGKNLATATQDIVTAGDAAQRSLISINRLETALSNSPQGAIGGLASIAGNLGIKTEGSSELEVAEALISQLVPAQRPPGSGTMSDADLALFKKSLPRLINTPEGNKQIIDTIRAIAEYDIARGDIAAQVQFKEITASEGRKAYRNLANPLADIGKNPPPPEVSTSGANSSFSLSEDDASLLEKYK